MKRRDFLKLLGVGASGPFFTRIFKYKKQAVEYLIPYVVPPEDIIPGVANWYSSVCRQCSAGCGIQVKLRDGRAKKIEGNPLFPINQGRLCARGQAGLQVLYNPDRIKTPLKKEGKGFKRISWNEGLNFLAANLGELRESGQSDKLIFLSEPLRGSLGKLITTFMEKLGSKNVFSYEFFNDEALVKANELCFGYKGIPHYDLGKAKYVLSFGANFLDTWVSPVKHSVGYGEFRGRPILERGKLIHFEPRLSLTGASADEWFSLNPETEGLLALSMAYVIVAEGLVHPGIIAETPVWKGVLKDYAPEVVAKKTGVKSKEISRVAKEFALAGPSLALCGGSATAQTNGVFNAAAVNILNYLVGSVGKEGGIRFSAPSPFGEAIEENISYDGLVDLARKMEAGEVKAAFLHNVNPVFNLPKDSHFAKALKKVPLVVSFSSFMDESTALADLVLPDHTYLESWGDYIPLTDNGRKAIGVMQPITKPLYNTGALGDTILSLAKALGTEVATALPWVSFEDFLKSSWRIFYEKGRGEGKIPELSFENFWENILAKGGWWEERESELPPAKAPSPSLLKEITFKEEEGPAADGGDDSFHLYLYPSQGSYDGRGANQPWLQQLPEPLITATWGSWVEINPERAKKMGVKEGDILEIKSPNGKLRAPAYLYPAISEEMVAIPIGQGHSTYGRYAKGKGVNPLEILVSLKEDFSGALAWASTKVKISKVGKQDRILKTEPVVIQPGLEEGLRELEREIVQWIEPKEARKVEGKELEPIKALPTRDLKKGPHFLTGVGLRKYRTTKYHKYKYRWGMVIDLDKCTGCQACMVACYAENNLPIVEPLEMSRRRHKNWIRVDRYWAGDYPKIQAKLIPRPCYHCGNAPCEPVCPVYAAFHNVDGLNGQVYQRCIGTRFCNVGCPYRVRLFNWFHPKWPKPLDQQLNPDVSVRPSGITDKCTFCVQRLRAAKDKAKDEGRMVRDGEVEPACVQTCPSGAITFGNLMDSKAQVSKLTRSPRRYRVLEELNTEPAVIYLKAIRKSVEHGKEKKEETH